MNRIHCLITLLLLCFVGTAQAQKAWELVSDQSVDEIKPNHYYVLKEGDNTHTGGTSGGHSNGLYLTIDEGGMSANLTHGAIFTFVADGGENADGFQKYVLRNEANGKYLGKNTRFVNTKAEAYHFTVAKAEAIDEKDSRNGEDAEWIDYHNIVSNSRSIYAQESGAWVLCHPDKKEYIGFVGAPNFNVWIDTNNWLILEAKERIMTSQEKLLVLFDKYFAEPVSEELYPIGTNPGCVSATFYARLLAVYNEVVALTGHLDSASDEECEKAIEEVNAVIAALDTEVIPVGPGYYLVKNVRGGYLRDNDKGYADNNLVVPVESWNSKTIKYIWQVEAAEQTGKIQFKNLATNRYLGKGDKFDMVEEPNGAYTTPHYKATLFNLHDGSRLVNVKNNGFMTYWDQKDDPGNQYTFEFVEKAALDTLLPKMEQQVKNKKLAELVDQANFDLASVKYTNGFMELGAYNHPADTGLVRNFMKANATSHKEGTEAAAFDANFESYYHTAYGDDAVLNEIEGQKHWVQFDLGKKVSDLVIKFTERKGHYNGSPVRFTLLGAAGDDADGEWDVVLAKSKDSIEYQFASSFKDSSTFIGKFHLDVPSRYVRFVVDKTKKDIKPSGTGPLWHVSEFRLYDVKDIQKNPKFDLVDSDVLATLKNTIEKAEALLKKGEANETVYAELEEALEGFWASYPDPSSLENTLETAQEMIDGAREGTKLAEYKVGSVAVLKAVVAKISAAAEKTLTLSEIKAYEKELDAAIAEFNANLNVPAADKIYRLVCVAPYEMPEGNPHAQWNTCVSTLNADIYDNPVWRYSTNDDVSNRLNTLWEVKQDAEGFTFRNIANGLYLGNPYEGLTDEEKKEVKGGLIGYSVEPKHFTLEAATLAEEAFLINFTKGEYLNCDPIGKVVHYGDRNDLHAFFAFQEVEDYEGSYAIETEPSKVQILSVPVALEGLYTLGNEKYGTDGYALKVKGMMDGKIQLDYYAEGETIPAGVPFVVVTAADETFAEGFVDGDLEALKSMEYNYAAENQLGMISCPIAFKAKDAYGIIVNDRVIPAEEGVLIKAGTGFFNNEIPETKEAGEFFLEVEGDITGVGTAVEGVGVVKNVANDVYTVSGVKVRQNVKSGVATKGLPKGIYIVGGKKVVVK